MNRCAGEPWRIAMFRGRNLSRSCTADQGGIAGVAHRAHDRRPDPAGPTALNAIHAIRRVVAYLWASPNSMIGALAGGAMLCAGGQVQRIQGVAEFHGGALGRFFANLPHPYCFAAITFGHVILGTDVAQLDAARRHEHVHVCQYERWGVFMLPMYALSSAWQLLRGRRPYRDNMFEREAYAVDECG